MLSPQTHSVCAACSRKANRNPRASHSDSLQQPVESEVEHGVHTHLANAVRGYDDANR